MDDFLKTFGYTKADWEACIKVLSTLKDDPFNNPDNQQLGTLITCIHKHAKKSKRKSSYQEKKLHDLHTINTSVISLHALKNRTQYNASNAGESPQFKGLEIPKNCYCCNQSFSMLHFFYSRLCPECAIENYENRFKSIDLTGRNVILTGGRVKIGYATALKFLRSNANLTVTTRFPALAFEQFKTEVDYDSWKNRLTVYGLDLRSMSSLNEFIAYYLSNFESLDILVNNAAQTISYPEEYYSPLIQKERLLIDQLAGETKLLENKTSVVGDVKNLLGKEGDSFTELNRFGQPVDNREKNSWNSTLAEVELTELLEVNLINQISPYVLIKELTKMMHASSFDKKFIINVTSSEGQFSYTNKSMFHPHTNMTKASLNMLTRTSAKEYEKYRIFMNAVDVGWVSTGANEDLRKKQFDKGYIPPLDPVDGASRIMIPIIDGISGKHFAVGKLWKNYKITDW